MIHIRNISKNFEEIRALDNISFTINQGSIWGILGINGAGKSTLLKIMAGILRADSGEISLNSEPLFDNPKLKKYVFYLPDDPYILPNATIISMAEYYAGSYSDFDRQRYKELYEALGLNGVRKMRTFSKGMKRQVFILLALCSNASYLLCDEIFDGLDPIIRNTICELLVNEVEHRGLTLIMASHNLRELEDFCEYVGIIHQGGMLLLKELKQAKSNTHKFQCIFTDQSYLALQEKLEVLSVRVTGFVVTLLIKGEQGGIEQEIRQTNVEKYEELPLTIEEIFMYESEVCGYDIKAILS